MEQSSLTNEVAKGMPETKSKNLTGSQASETVEVKPAGVSSLDSGQQTAQVQTKQNVWDYKTDSRWNKVWKSEADIIQGYKLLNDILETKYKPTFKQYEDLSKLFKDNGLEIGKVNDYIQEYQSLKDPKNTVNQVYNILLELLGDDDLAAQDFDLAIAKIHEEKLGRKYPGATKELREKLIVQEKETQELKSWKDQLQIQENDKIATENVKTGLEQIKKISVSKGFDFTDDIRNEFLTHCIQNNIPTNYMIQEFRNKFDEALDKAYENKVKAGMLEDQQKKNKTTIQMTKVQKTDLSKKKDFMTKLSEAFQKKEQT